MKRVSTLVGFAVLGLLAAGIGLKYANATPCNSGCGTTPTGGCTGNASGNGCASSGCEDDWYESHKKACGTGYVEYSNAAIYGFDTGNANTETIYYNCKWVQTCMRDLQSNSYCEWGVGCHSLITVTCNYCTGSTASWTLKGSCSAYPCGEGG